MDKCDYQKEKCIYIILTFTFTFTLNKRIINQKNLRKNKSLYIASSSHFNSSFLRSSEITIQSLSLEKGTTIVGDTRRSDSPCSISLSIDQKPPSRPPFRNLSLERVSSGPVFLEDRCPSRSWHGLRGRPGAGARGISRPGCDIDRSNAPKGGEGG